MENTDTADNFCQQNMLVQCKWVTYCHSMVWSHFVGAGYGSQWWKFTVMLNGRRVMQTLFTRLGFDENAVDKTLPKVVECYLCYGGPET
jgi:hypothetical protein